MAQKILSSSGGYFYVNELAIPKGSVYFKRMASTGVGIYPIEKDSRLVIGSISVAEALNGDEGNAPFTYDSLLDWVEMNTAAMPGTAGGGAGSGDVDTTNLATKQNQSTQIVRETEIRDNVISLVGKIPANPSTLEGQNSQSATLASILAKLTSDPATQTTLAAILSKLITNPATSDNQTASNVILNLLLAKLTADPATQTYQSTGNNSLNSIDAKTPSQGQKTAVNSSPVIIASDQPALPISAASLPLPNNAATEVKQDTGNTALNAILTRLGQSLAANSDAMFPLATMSAQATNSDFFNGMVGRGKVLTFTFANASTGSVRVSFSSDGIQWSGPVLVQQVVANAQAITFTPSATEIYKVPALLPYVRIFVFSALSVPTTMSLFATNDDRAYDLSSFNSIVTGAVTVSNGTFDVVPIASNNGYNVAHKLIAAATTNATLVKNSPAKINWIYVFNGSAAIVYFKPVNGSAAPTPGTSLPTYTWPVEAGKGMLFKIDNTKFLVGLSYLITAGASDTDATAVGAGVIVSANYI